MTAYQLEHAAELCTSEGPHGGLVEVIRGEVRDHGGNVLFAGTADECVANRKGWRIPTRLCGTECRRVDGEVAGADVMWDYATESLAVAK